jgi:UDP-glucose 4-epimerase
MKTPGKTRKPSTAAAAGPAAAGTDLPARPAVMVTGAGGALGQHVVRRLRRDYQVIAVDFRHKPELGGDVHGYKVDFNKREFEDIFRRHKPVGVIHLGRILVSQGNRASRYAANVLGTQKLLDLCVKYGVGQVLVLSTYHVYGAHPYNPALIEENAPLKATEIASDLVDSVELENLSMIYLWKHPQLRMTILRPCNVLGPGVNNTMSRILASRHAPWLVGFSPVMQFIHVEDLADAIQVAFRKSHPGVYNVAPEDWVAYDVALKRCGCRRLPIPSVPADVPKTISRLLGWKSFPLYLVNYFKFPVVIDGTLFRNTFGFAPRYSLEETFAHYREQKEGT